MKKRKGQYAGSQAPLEAGMRLRSCSHRKLDGITFRAGQSYPADDPTVMKYRFHFRVAAFPPSVVPAEELSAPEESSEVLGSEITPERLADPED